MCLFQISGSTKTISKQKASYDRLSASHILQHVRQVYHMAFVTYNSI